MTMSAIVRPATRTDVDRLAGLLAHVDPGMLTMPSSREAMAERVERSLAAFGRPIGPPQGECYFLVMEEAGEIIGTAGLFTNLGFDRPFYSYRILRNSKVSPEQNVKVELDLLHLVNDYHGDTELGTFFILPRARGGGRGRLLSYARLLLIASDPKRFGARAMAEIRGWTDKAGRSPFWEAVGRKFFHMDYSVADQLSARDHRFIADLMPRYPIYKDLLPAEAQSVIGRPHPGAEPALALLQAQGFRLNHVVDIFDAGPCVEAFVDQIGIVREAAPASLDDFVTSGGPGLAAVASLDRFAATQFRKDEDRDAVLARLGASRADPLLVYPMRERRP